MANQSGGLEDRGWQQMKSLLDKEMPVERKKRFFFWPVVGAATIVLILTTVYWSQQFPLDGRSLPDFAETADGFDPQDVDRVDPVDPQEEQLLQESTKLESTPSAPKIVESRVGTQGNEAVAETRRDIVSSETLKRVGDTETILDRQEDVFPTDPLLWGEGVEELSAVADSARIPAVSSGNIDFEITALHALEGKVFAIEHHSVLQGFPSTLEDLVALKPIAVEKKTHWGLAPVASLLAERKGHRWGGDLGIQVDFSFADLLAVESGISVFILNPNQTYSREIDTDVQWSSDRFANDLVLDFASNPQNMADQMSVAEVNKALYIRIPFQLRFRPSRKMQPYIGTDRLFLLPSGRNEDTLEATQSPGTGGVVQQEILELRKSNWVWKAGIVFQPKEHVFFDVSYSHGNKSYLDADVDPGNHIEIHRFFRLGMGYRFGRW